MKKNSNPYMGPDGFPLKGKHKEFFECGEQRKACQARSWETS